MNSKLLLLLGIHWLAFSCKHSDQQSVELDFNPFSTAIVEVDIVNPLADTLMIRGRATSLMPAREYVTEYVTITHPGKYYLYLTLDRPAEGTIAINDSSFHIILVPADTTKLSFNHNSYAVNFVGDYERINEYLFDRDKLRLQQQLELKDGLVKQKIDFLNEHFNKGIIPGWYYQIEKADIEYRTARDKFISSGNPNEKFPVAVRIDNDNAVFSFWYYLFLDEYFLRGIDLGKLETQAGFSRATGIYSKIQERADTVLSGRAKKYYYEYIFGIVASMTTDSLTIDSLAKQYQVIDFKKYRNPFRSPTGEDQLGIDKVIPEFIGLNVLGERVSIRSFSDKKIYINFYATWCAPCLENIPALNSFIDTYSTDTKIIFLNICMDSKVEDWNKLIKKTKLKGINLFLDEGSSKVKSQFNMMGVPVYVLLDRKNRLFQNNASKAPDVRVAIEKLIKRNEEESVH